MCCKPDRVLLAELANLWDGKKESAISEVRLLKSRLVRTREVLPRVGNNAILYTAAGFWQLAPILDEWTDGRVKEVVALIAERLATDD